MHLDYVIVAVCHRYCLFVSCIILILEKLFLDNYNGTYFFIHFLFERGETTIIPHHMQLSLFPHATCNVLREVAIIYIYNHVKVKDAQYTMTL